ncbi:putative inhibitor of apoptosis [Melanaphis sacchari]|nr:putative inhibitor of apoptosis [Melanaphis sacchari]
MDMQRRLSSFNEMWRVNFLRPCDMAQAGFFYLGIGDQVKCGKCCKEFLDWEFADDPLQQHIRLSPDCSFVNKILATVDGRLRTFKNWPVIFLKSREMADAGFFYTGQGDGVKCFKCCKLFESWECGDVPLIEHYRHSPKCSVVDGFGDILYETCVYGSSTSDALSSVSVGSVDDWLTSEGILQSLKPFHRNKMITFNARLETFNNCLRTFKQNINTLCEAGFFYSGNGQTDFTTCYFCALTLSNWTDDDEPWINHAKWSKNCGHLFLNKSKNFVDKVHVVENFTINFNHLALFNLIAKQKNKCILWTKMKIQMTKKYLNGIQLTDNLFVKNQHHFSEILDHNSLPDCMLCKICFKEEIKVVFVPCGHAISCIECALTLIFCPICRFPLVKIMGVYLCMNEKNYENVQQVTSNSEMSSSNTLKHPMNCKVCHKKEMAAVLLPCKHIYTCDKCAEDISECSICRQNVYSLIKIYF